MTAVSIYLLLNISRIRRDGCFSFFHFYMLRRAICLFTVSLKQWSVQCTQTGWTLLYSSLVMYRMIVICLFSETFFCWYVLLGCIKIWDYGALCVCVCVCCSKKTTYSVHFRALRDGMTHQWHNIRKESVWYFWYLVYKELYTVPVLCINAYIHLFT